MNKIDKHIRHCSICNKPMEISFRVDKAKVMHMSCLMEKTKEIREKPQKRG